LHEADGALIKVIFGWGAGFLYNSQQQLDEFNAGSTPVSAYSWLSELCLHKVDRLSQLKTVCIKEVLKWYRGSPYPSVVWCPPHTSKYFQDNRIDLDVQLREHYTRNYYAGANPKRAERKLKRIQQQQLLESTTIV
jgi:hypothetical protein